MSNIEANKQLVQRFLAALSSGDLGETLGFLHEDSTWWVAGKTAVSGTYTKSEFGKLLGGIAANVDGAITLTPKAYTAEGNRVAVECESLAHFKNGRTYNNFYHFLFEVKDEQLYRIKEYLDTMHVQEVVLAP